MCAKQVKPAAKDVPTTGHVWDGIQEYDNPMPRWWLWVLYLTILWGVAYTIAYPAWPLISGHTQGLIGSDQRADVAAEIQRFDDANAGIKAKLVAADLAAIPTQDELKTFAVSAGASVFKNNCAQCHGAGAAGVQGKGYPNLLDNDWLWGGDMAAIHATVTHGIRNSADEDARYSQMPAFGVDGILEKPQIAEVVQFVRRISGQDFDAALAASGVTVFADNCASCHGEAGKGDRTQGAPDLTDAIWLYGGDVATLTETVSKARFGVMPAWGDKLSEDEIRAVAVYVHSLGGGE
ncbi:Cbb3-type cytochrome c oxidase subunit CcoP [Cypionkella aquatica]|uniref:Cbb3-type cytochrome c oxidase subunit n=1 Tax=Cypionkella aquatica TaxID=1756042 RepID=A0AA37X202_9RHOB|nr:cytochrome-c oxidase, cbb3-type subunit III [Cypionkella aquatica]GLS85731.1 Cbb3-type cytochrome c oxidase subunit CcoP [Cypionkella aquatica]